MRKSLIFVIPAACGEPLVEPRQRDPFFGTFAITSPYKTNGMERSVVILSLRCNSKGLPRKLVSINGNNIDASKRANWEGLGKNWLVSADDHDK